MKIAVVGSGIAGLVAARALAREHELAVFEAADWIGGHTHTVDVPVAGSEPLAIDTGFIVFNERTYPNFCALLRELGVEWQASDMGFSVHGPGSRFEYSGSGWNGLLARRTTALRPAFWRLLLDLLRFYREAPACLEPGAPDLTLGEYLRARGYSRVFVDQHLVPMASAVWSARAQELADFPLRFLVRFFHNHGFLQVDGRPQWLVVRGGSRRYVDALVAPFRERIRLRTPVLRVERVASGVRLWTREGPEDFERVVLATHADTSLALLADATPLERRLLGAFRYQANQVVLHTDRRLMPRARRAWASWNYHLASPPVALPTVTYWMNRLQGLQQPLDYLVTLNRSEEIAPEQVLQRFVYHHPVYSAEAVAAQGRHEAIDGQRGVHFCGAYWGYGFHEDGVKSGLAVAARIARSLPGSTPELPLQSAAHSRGRP